MSPPARYTVFSLALDQQTFRARSVVNLFKFALLCTALEVLPEPFSYMIPDLTTVASPFSQASTSSQRFI